MLLKLKNLQPMKKYFATMFLISCVLLGIFTLVIYRQSVLNQASHRWVVHSYEVMRHTRDVLIHVYDSDAAERQYLATAAPAALDAYKETTADIDGDIDSLAALLGDSPAQESPWIFCARRPRRLKR